MLVMLVVAALGCLVGFATRDRTVPVAQWRLRAWPVLIAAIALQSVLGLVPVWARGPLAALNCAAVALWALANMRRRSGLRGPVLVAAGCALNSVVVAANGGMPVSRWALGHAGLSPALAVAKGHLDKHVAMTSGSHLRLLGDIIPLGAGRTVMSGGDVLMLAGIALATWSLFHSHHPESLRPDGRPELTVAGLGT
jgi:hypothetical protein